MTSEDINDDCKTVLRISHGLYEQLGRRPSLTEIQWRSASHFQFHHTISRKDAMKLASTLVDVIITAADYTHG